MIRLAAAYVALALGGLAGATAITVDARDDGACARATAALMASTEGRYTGATTVAYQWACLWRYPRPS